MHLGEAAAQEQSVYIRQRAVAQRVDGDQLGAAGAKRLQIPGIVEAEGGVPGDTQAHIRGDLPLGRAAALDAPEGRVAAGHRQHPVQVHLRRYQVADALDRLRCLGVFAGRHQADVPFRNIELLVLADGAEHGHVRVVRKRRAQLALVACAAHLIEYHATDANVVVGALAEALEAANHRCDAAGHAPGIDDQNHRRAEALRQRRVAVAAIQADAVEKPLGPFDDADVGPGRVAYEGRRDLVAVHGVKVQVVAVASGSRTEPQGIDEVGALLEGLHREAAGTQRRAQSDADNGLAGGFVRCRYE